VVRGTKYPLLLPARSIAPPPGTLIGPIQVEALRQKLATEFRLWLQYLIIPLASSAPPVDQARISARHFLFFIFFSWVGYRMINPLTGACAINLSVPLIRDFIIFFISPWYQNVLLFNYEPVTLLFFIL